MRSPSKVYVIKRRGKTRILYKGGIRMRHPARRFSVRCGRRSEINGRTSNSGYHHHRHLPEPGGSMERSEKEAAILNKAPRPRNGIAQNMRTKLIRQRAPSARNTLPRIPRIFITTPRSAV